MKNSCLRVIMILLFNWVVIAQSPHQHGVELLQPVNDNVVYLVLTSHEVNVEGFCMTCGFHVNFLG